jgi:hypothetical protein
MAPGKHRLRQGAAAFTAGHDQPFIFEHKQMMTGRRDVGLRALGRSMI